MGWVWGVRESDQIFCPKNGVFTYCHMGKTEERTNFGGQGYREEIQNSILSMLI